MPVPKLGVGGELSLEEIGSLSSPFIESGAWESFFKRKKEIRLLYTKRKRLKIIFSHLKKSRETVYKRPFAILE
jgi:hypothetical protein